MGPIDKKAMAMTLMKYVTSLGLSVLLAEGMVCAEIPTAAIFETVQNYLDGTRFGDPDSIEIAYAESLEFQWFGEGEVLMHRTAAGYIDLFSDGKFRDRKGSVTMIDATDRAATVNAENERTGRRYTDYMLLLDIAESLKTTNKIAVFSKTDSSVEHWVFSCPKKCEGSEGCSIFPQKHFPSLLMRGSGDNPSLIPKCIVVRADFVFPNM